MRNLQKARETTETHGEIDSTGLQGVSPNRHTTSLASSGSGFDVCTSPQNGKARNILPRRSHSPSGCRARFCFGVHPPSDESPDDLKPSAGQVKQGDMPCVFHGVCRVQEIASFWNRSDQPPRFFVFSARTAENTSRLFALREDSHEIANDPTLSTGVIPPHSSWYPLLTYRSNCPCVSPLVTAMWPRDAVTTSMAALRRRGCVAHGFRWVAGCRSTFSSGRPDGWVGSSPLS